MILCMLPLALLCFYRLKVYKQMNTDYLAKEQTGAIKGIFVLMVFLVHVMEYIQMEDTIADKLYDFILGVFRQNIVIVFLLYSGFGIGQAYLARGKAYISRLPRSRIFTTWLHFVLAILLFWMLNILVIHTDYSVMDYVLSLFAWKSVGNSTWFVLAILVCWICTFLVFSIFRNKYHALACLTLFLCVYIWVIKEVKVDHAWYDTVLCYPLGLLVAFEKEKVDRFLCSGWRTVWALVLLGLAWVTLRVFVEKTVVLYEIQSVLFALFMLALTSRVRIYNSVLAWLGKHSFSVYILQRIPMLLLEHFGVSEWNRGIFILGCAVLTTALAWGFDLLTDALDLRLRKEQPKTP